LIVLDTTVLVYAVGGEHPLRQPSRDLIEAVAEGQVEATTSVEVIQEFVHVRARRRDRHDAADRGRELLRLLGPFITPGEAELAMALQLFEDYDDLGMFDAVLAAMTMLSGADALVSADGAFSAVRGLTHLDPAGPEVQHLIGA
jgi:predicted nucleic acid-binding protein